MAEVKYTLQYLPTFYTDLEEHVMYISHVLKNVQAANELLNTVCWIGTKHYEFQSL